MLTNRRTIGAKVEATYGSAETIAAGDLFFAYNIKFSPNVEEWARNPHKPSMSPLAPVKGRSRASISFDVELMGSGTAGTAPFWSPLIQACGRSLTTVASTSNTYDYATTSLKGITIKAFLDGVSVRMKGCRGSASCEMVAGQVPMLSFTFEGLWDYGTDTDAWKDEALVSGTAYPSFSPKPFIAALLKIDSYKALSERMSWNDNNTLTAVPEANTVSVYKRVDITGRAPSGNLDAEAVTIATKDFMDLFVKKSQVAISAYVGGDDSGNGTGSLNTMTDSTKNWRTDQFSSGYKLEDSAGATFTPTANGATTITVSGTPASGDYIIYEAGKLIKVSAPKVVVDTVSDDDKGGIYNFGLPFKMFQSSGDDELTIKVT